MKADAAAEGRKGSLKPQEPDTFHEISVGVHLSRKRPVFHLKQEASMTQAAAGGSNFEDCHSEETKAQLKWQAIEGRNEDLKFQSHVEG